MIELKSTRHQRSPFTVLEALNHEPGTTFTNKDDIVDEKYIYVVTEDQKGLKHLICVQSGLELTSAYTGRLVQADFIAYEVL